MGLPALKDPEPAYDRKIVLVTSDKGGTGKTTTALNVATAAAYDGRKVCCIDFDPQHSLDGWALRRKRYTMLPQVPVFAGHINHYEKLLDLSIDYDLVIIDSPPSISEHRKEISALIQLADFILVPTRTGPFDLFAVGPWVKDYIEPIKGHKVAFLLNQIAMRSVAYTRAFDYLTKRGRMCQTPIRLLSSVETSMITGNSVLDISGEDKGKDDFNRVWTFVRQELGQ